MKKLSYLPLTLAALMLGACSSDDVVVNEGAGNVPAGETGYVSLAVNLPTQPSTRAESFDDGLASEYAVNNATLLLFAGTSESDATFQSAYDLNVGNFGDGSSDGQITERASIVQEVTVPATTDNENIYALVVLNDNNLINVSDGGATVNGTALIEGTSTLTAFTESAQTFLNGAASITSGGILMSNAPLLNVQGGNKQPTGGTASTLALVDKSKIKATPTEAAADPAATIYVERAVAKVTVTDNGGGSVSGGNANLASYQILGWTFNNENTKTYLVRNVEDGAGWWEFTNTAHTVTGDAYRFVGGLQVNAGETPALYRTYWGVDPNYSTPSLAEFIVKDETVIANSALYGLGSNNPGYCLENTFNVDNQKDDRTTSVIVKAKLNLAEGVSADADGSFYTVNDVTSQLYNTTGVEDYVKALAMNKWITANWSTYAETNLDGDLLDVVLSNETNNEGGYITVTSITVPESAKVTWRSGHDRDEFNAALAAQLSTITSGLKIGYYKGGEAYYNVLVKHFGDTQAPWKETDIEDGNSYAGSASTANWLGRYGTLRNNWYEVSVSGIKNIGSPSVPDATGKQDDPSTSYIAVEINVLSWAKRSQTADL